MVVPAAEENEKPDPIPGYECHITANPVERNSAVEEKIRRSQVNTREPHFWFSWRILMKAVLLSPMCNGGSRISQTGRGVKDANPCAWGKNLLFGNILPKIV